ncbi:YraN family protein [Prosthecomicrobium hirschii]|uniref:YraN family protein n=1 Tax=Prosthecodimorpha hirschii TaxID=665126 RepID=UPI00221EA330|nr:YraN family protein [Prosthecomicrobium hirschii]MCW1842092.1 YraN family protein [Prosthecomicrobium hirschii]
MTRPAADPSRVSAYRWGLSAETRAAWLLRLKGYAILDRRFRAAGGEIDLVARRGRTVVFVEVKARATLDAALEALDDRTARRIAAAAEIWIARRPALQDFDQRFDLVAVVPRRWPHHMPDAFRPRA